MFTVRSVEGVRQEICREMSRKVQGFVVRRTGRPLRGRHCTRRGVVLDRGMARAKGAPYHERWAMRVGARLRTGYVAAGVLAMGAAAAPRVAAQGGERVAHWVGHAPNVSPAASQVGPARSVL